MPTKQRKPLQPHEEQFLAAALYGDSVIMRRLLEEHGMSLLAVRTHTGDLALHIVAIKGNLTAVKLLIEYGAPLDAEGYDGTPLHYAGSEGKIDVVRCLLDAGASINCRCEDGTPLMGAMDGGHHDVMRLLLDRGALTYESRDIDDESNFLVDAEGDDAGFRIRENNDPVAFKEFVERGLIPVDNEYTLLDWVLSDTDLDVSELVLACLSDPALGGEVPVRRLQMHLEQSENDEVIAVLTSEISRIEVTSAVGDGCGDASPRSSAHGMSL